MLKTPVKTPIIYSNFGFQNEMQIIHGCGIAKTDDVSKFEIVHHGGESE